MCRPPQLVPLSKEVGRNLCVQNDIVANLKMTGSALEAAALSLARHPIGNEPSGDPNAIACRQRDIQTDTRVLSPLTCAHNSYWVKLDHQAHANPISGFLPYAVSYNAMAD